MFPVKQCKLPGVVFILFAMDLYKDLRLTCWPLTIEAQVRSAASTQEMVCGYQLSLVDFLWVL